MLNIIQPSNDEEVDNIDWHQIWRSSPEFQSVKQELQRLNALPSTKPDGTSAFDNADASQHQEFVASFWTQFREVLIRTWKNFWRSPTYIWSKTVLIILSVCFIVLKERALTNNCQSLYIGFTFEAKNTIQGLQNQLYAIFMYMVLFQSITNQIMPIFVPQRALYEVRERPSKIYRWNSKFTPKSTLRDFC